VNEKQKLKPGRDFNLRSLLWRFVGVLLLVCFTYNPTRAS
jgi:hypothetical protein